MLEEGLSYILAQVGAKAFQNPWPIYVPDDFLRLPEYHLV